MSETWTVRRTLTWMAADFEGRGISSPRLDAELLLAHALRCDRVRLYLDFDRPLSPNELGDTRELVRRRRRREPVAHILGDKEFYRRGFRVTPQVLTPRPETELLVDRALAVLPDEARRALDLCTGSGAIAITLAAERPGLAVDATDISQPALAIASENAERHGVAQRVSLYQGDLFEALPPAQRYTLVAANPPYVGEGEWSELEPEVRVHEPREALLGGGDGLRVIDAIVRRAADWLEPGGTLLIEVGHRQAAEVMRRLREDPRYERVLSHRDLAGIERVVECARS